MSHAQCLAESRTDSIIGLSAGNSPHVRFESITKRFGKVLANDSVSCTIAAGGIHAFLGENGAGKSTLMKILCGHYQADSGSIHINHVPVTLRSPSQARQHGIAMVHQNFTLVPSMTVVENVLLGDPTNAPLISYKKQAEKVAGKAAEFGITINPITPVWQLSVAERQKVEILKLLWRDANILILDEPTSQLAPFEAEEILMTLDRLSKQNRIVILISHHIDEILRFSKHISVLRKGACLANLATENVEAQELARLMIDTLDMSVPDKPRADVQFPIFSMHNVSLLGSQRNRTLNSVNLDLYTGEVLGIAGVIGSGQDEVAAILAGLLEPEKGTLTLDGKGASWKSLKQTSLVSYIPSDAKKASVSGLSATENSLLRDVHRKDFGRGPFLKMQLIKKTAQARIESFDVRPSDPNVLCGSLSGGNLQRLILARELDNQSKIVVAVNPVAGLDLAMCQRVQKELKAAAASGKAVVLISPDLQELLLTCDRIAVMCAGSIVGVELAENLDSEALGLLLGGVKLEVVQQLFKLLKSGESVSADRELRNTLTQLLRGDSIWQKRLAAQMALQVFVLEDLHEVLALLAGETNDECRAWLQIIRTKLNWPNTVSELEREFKEQPSIFADVQRRILKCQDIKGLKNILSERLNQGLSGWQSLLAKLTLNHLEVERKAALADQSLVTSVAPVASI